MHECRITELKAEMVILRENWSFHYDRNSTKKKKNMERQIV